MTYTAFNMHKRYTLASVEQAKSKLSDAKKASPRIVLKEISKRNGVAKPALSKFV